MTIYTKSCDFKSTVNDSFWSWSTPKEKKELD